MMVEEIIREIARIVEQSRPSCGLMKECNTECGNCGAERIMSYLAEQGAAIVTPHGLMMLKDLLNNRGGKDG